MQRAACLVPPRTHTHYGLCLVSQDISDTQKPAFDQAKPSDVGILIGTWVILLLLGAAYVMWPTWAGAGPLVVSEIGPREAIAFLGAAASLLSAVWFSFKYMRARRMNELGIMDILGLIGTIVGCSAAVEIGLSAAGIL